ncbi:MAG TPA: hypothetical protein VHX39_12215 [Acetobacteraceae bacterium]|nr:hypothetical protein [Acetobacteraceae bacterium]
MARKPRSTRAATGANQVGSIPAGAPSDLPLSDEEFIAQSQRQDRQHQVAQEQQQARLAARVRFEQLRDDLKWYGERQDQESGTPQGLIDLIADLLSAAKEASILVPRDHSDQANDPARQWAVRIFRHIAAGRKAAALKLLQHAGPSASWPWTRDWIKRRLIDEAIHPSPSFPANQESSTAPDASALAAPTVPAASAPAATAIPASASGDEAAAEANPVHWLTLVEAEQLSAINRGVISRAVTAGEIASNGKKGRQRRLDAADFVRWQLARARRPEAPEGNEQVREQFRQLGSR